MYTCLFYLFDKYINMLVLDVDVGILLDAIQYKITFFYIYFCSNIIQIQEECIHVVYIFYFFLFYFNFLISVEKFLMFCQKLLALVILPALWV